MIDFAESEFVHPLEETGMTRKQAHIALTLILMLVVTRFVIRIVDATVQIEDDIGMLLALLVIVNAAIGVVSYKLYKTKF